MYCYIENALVQTVYFLNNSKEPQHILWYSKACSPPVCKEEIVHPGQITSYRFWANSNPYILSPTDLGYLQVRIGPQNNQVITPRRFLKNRLLPLDFLQTS